MYSGTGLAAYSDTDWLQWHHGYSDSFDHLSKMMRLQWHPAYSDIPMVSLLAGRSEHFWTNLHNHRKLCVTVRQRARLMLGMDNPMRPICKACLSFSSSFSAFTEKSVSFENTGISGQISSMDREIVVKLHHPIGEQGNIKTMSYNKADGKCKLWYFTIHLPKNMYWIEEMI